MTGDGARVDWSVLVGPSPRLAGLEAPLAAFASGADLEIGVGALDDLARLLPGFAGPGRVLIDVDHVDSEDIGLVRRFLATNPDWSIVLFGDDASRRTARVLSSLERTQWQAWPPDLDQLRLLVASPFDAEHGGADAETAPQMTHLSGGRGPEDAFELARLAERLRRSFAALREDVNDATLSRHEQELEQLVAWTRGGDAADDDEPEVVLEPADGRTPFDVGELLEEKLAALAVRGRQAPRYHFQGDGPLSVLGDRDVVAGAFDTLLRLARLCSGPGEIIRVQAVATSSGGAPFVDVTVSWPPGLLEELDPSEALQPGRVAELLPGMESHDVAAAARALEAGGGTIELEADERGRWRAAVRLHQANHGRPTAVAGTS